MHHSESVHPRGWGATPVNPQFDVEREDEDVESWCFSPATHPMHDWEALINVPYETLHIVQTAVTCKRVHACIHN